MALKDRVAEDLDRVFFNQEEFATLHTLAGRTIRCIVDSDQLQQYALKGLPGLYEADQLLYIQEKDLMGLNFTEGKMVVLDGAQYSIAKVTHVDGLMELSLMGVRR